MSLTISGNPVLLFFRAPCEPRGSHPTTTYIFEKPDLALTKIELPELLRPFVKLACCSTLTCL